MTALISDKLPTGALRDLVINVSNMYKALKDNISANLSAKDAQPEEKVWCPDNGVVVQIGSYDRETPKSDHPCFHREWELQYIHRGRGSTFIRDKVYRFEKGYVLIVHTDEIHNDIFEQHSDFESTEIRFLPQVMIGRQDGESAIEVLASHYRLDLSERDSVALEYHLKSMNEECKMRRDHWEGAARNYLENVLIILARAAAEGRVDRFKEAEFSPEIVAYVEERLHSRLSLAAAARDLGISMFTLSRTFKRSVGMGFQEYIIHRRIADARGLLEETDLKVEAIARRVGFSDISTFYRSFRLATGVSPRNYRRTVSATERISS